MKISSILCLICLIAALASGAAAATLSVAPAGDGVFVLRGTAVERAGAMEITITYDAAVLGNPRLVPGELISGALTAVNATIPGTVRIGIIRTLPIQGDGIIATLSFDRKGTATGAIRPPTAMLNSLVQLGGEGAGPGPVLAEEPGREAEPTVAAPVPASESVAPGVPVRGGTVTGVVTGLTGEGAVAEEASAAERTAEDVAVEGVAAEVQAAPAEEPKGDEAAPPEKEVLVLASVLDRFREHAGERSLRAFTALFEQSGAGGFTQSPAPLLADGKSVLEVVFAAAPEDAHVAEMTAAGARLLDRAQDPDDPQTWVVQLQPERGAASASLSIPLESFVIVFPLAVAPRLRIDLDGSGTVTPADFALFLKKRSAFDFNGDGRRDYRDDYLFTANYLAALREETQSGSKAVSTKKVGATATEAPRKEKQNPAN